jgi:CBS domain-containing protein
MVFATRPPAALATRLLRRGLTFSRARLGGHMTVSSVLSTNSGVVPTVDHNMSVERAAQLMAECHIDAVPVTKDDRVIGLFTERDYFDKVLNARHQATRSSMVCEVGIMGPDLVVARPNDTVEDCLTVMAKQNLMALPVVEEDGHAVGTVSVLDLTRQYMEDEQDRTHKAHFSQPTFFPEDLVLPDGCVHDEELDDPARAAMLAEDPTNALLEHTDHELEELAAERFCEGSVFPEFTATEELLLARAHDELAHAGVVDSPITEREERFSAAYAEVLGRMDRFSEPSDFPEAEPVDEAMQARA